MDMVGRQEWPWAEEGLCLLWRIDVKDGTGCQGTVLMS